MKTLLIVVLMLACAADALAQTRPQAKAAPTRGSAELTSAELIGGCAVSIRPTPADRLGEVVCLGVLGYPVTDPFCLNLGTMDGEWNGEHLVGCKEPHILVAIPGGELRPTERERFGGMWPDILDRCKVIQTQYKSAGGRLLRMSCEGGIGELLADPEKGHILKTGSFEKR